MNKEYLQKITENSITKYIDEIDKLLITKASTGAYELTYTFNKISINLINLLKKHYENQNIKVRYGKKVYVDYIMSDHLIVEDDTRTLIFNWS